jgi:hypothetical protein
MEYPRNNFFNRSEEDFKFKKGDSVTIENEVKKISPKHLIKFIGKSFKVHRAYRETVAPSFKVSGVLYELDTKDEDISIITISENYLIKEKN